MGNWFSSDTNTQPQHTNQIIQERWDEDWEWEQNKRRALLNQYYRSQHRNTSNTNYITSTKPQKYFPKHRSVRKDHLISHLLRTKNVFFSHVEVDNVYTLFDLQDTQEFHRIKKLFMQSNKKMYKVTSIYKINNNFLYLQYQIKLEQCRKQCHVVERELFHGTGKCNEGSICTNNFNWRCIKQHKFGYGVSFTPISYYATHYSDDKYEKIMFVASVMIGNKCVGKPNMVIPPIPYDTTEKENSQVIVKYDDCTYYPKYLIFYQGYDINKTRKKY